MQYKTFKKVPSQTENNKISEEFGRTG